MPASQKERSMRITRTLVPLFVLLLATSGFAQQTNAPARDPMWAKPLKVEGLPNLNKVSDILYRGAQPTAEGFKELKNMGVKTVVSLRAFHSDADLLGDTGLAYENISFKTWHPEDDDIVKFLNIVTDKTKQPVFVHCQHGADRTGTMCAIYRIVVDGWTKDQAIKEMTEGGFGFHAVWENLIDFIKALNIDEIKKAIQPPSATAEQRTVPHDTGRR
jgi:protein tyrosine/serine phosphatase